MGPPNLKFWSISRKGSLESQQKLALKKRFVRTLLFSSDTLNPGCNWKMLLRKRTSILDRVCVNYKQLFHPVQCIACRICQGSSRLKVVLPEVTGILSFSDQLPYLWVINCFCNGTQQYSTCLYQSESVHILSPTIIKSPFRRDTSSLESVSSMFGKYCISTTVSVCFSGKVFGVVNTTW